MIPFSKMQIMFSLVPCVSPPHFNKKGASLVINKCLVINNMFGN